MSTKDWSLNWPTQKELKETLKEKSQRQIARDHNIDRATLSNHLNGVKKQIPGQPVGSRKTFGTIKEKTKVKGDTAEVITAPAPVIQLGDAASMLKDRGLSPDDWEVNGMSVNEWDAPTEMGGRQRMQQLKVNLRRKRPEFLVRPPLAGKPVEIKPQRLPKAQVERNGKLVALLSDQHAPYHDEHLHQLTCQWLKANQPDEVVLMGDLVDFPSISRFAERHPEEWGANLQTNIDSAFALLCDYRAAAPNAKMVFIEGNHDVRLRDFLLRQAKDLWGLRRPGDAQSVLDLGYLLRFEDFGIEWVGHDDGQAYPHGAYALAPHCLVIHGDVARKGAGASPLASMSGEVAVVHGHTHRQAIVSKTIYAMSSKGKARPYTIYGAEVGCLCRRAAGYTSQRTLDWQQGFGTATVYEDQAGLYQLELASYAAGVLTWRGQRLTA